MAAERDRSETPAKMVSCISMMKSGKWADVGVNWDAVATVNGYFLR